MRLSKAGFIIVAMLSLQSCFVAKNYVRPDNVLEAEKFRTDQLPQDSLSIANLSWKQIFTDPILQNYIDTALTNNMDIRIALQQITMAEAYVKQGKAGYLPSINANANAAYQKSSANGQGLGNSVSVNQFELSGGFSWEIDIWGKIRSIRRAADASYLQSMAAHQAVKSRLIANIAATYYQLITLDEQIRVTEETIETRRKSLETTIALKEAGSVNEVGVQQTEAQLLAAQAILVDLLAQRRRTENAFSILLGSSPKQIQRNILADHNIDIPLILGVPSELLKNRPDVMAAEYGLMNAFELTNVAKSSF